MADQEKCPTCGTTVMRFDPPIEVEIGAACGAIKSGTYAGSHPGGVPVCQAPRGHEGKHTFIVEYVERW